MLANAEEGRWTAGREDSDAAASVEVPIHDCKKPTCIHVDEIAGKAHAQPVHFTMPLTYSLLQAHHVQEDAVHHA